MATKGSGGGWRSGRVITGVWLVLCAATVIAWLLSAGDGGTRHAALLVALAAAKIALIMAVFMGLARAPRGWAIAAAAWIIAFAAVVFAFHGGAGR